MAERRQAQSLLDLHLSSLKDDRSLRINQNSKRKLEDYLDPVLLQTISSRLSLTKMKDKHIERKDAFVNTTTRSSEFDWPVDLLDPLINDPKRDSAGVHGEEDDGSFLRR